MISKYAQFILAEDTNTSADLATYLRTDDIDPRRNEYLIPRWLKSELGDDYEELMGQDLAYDDLSNEERERFQDWLALNYDDEVTAADQDANRFFDKADRVSPETWLVHFTDKESASRIMRYGFKYGAHKDTMHLTKRYSRSQDSGRWIFSFVASSPYANSNQRKGHYGDAAILFKSSSAVKAYHTGDQEEQVIVDRLTLPVRDMVYIATTGRNSGEWYVGDSRHPYCIGPYLKVVRWVMQNYQQYRGLTPKVLQQADPGEYPEVDPYDDDYDYHESLRAPQSSLVDEVTNNALYMQRYLDSDEIDPYHYDYLIPDWASEEGADVAEEATYDDLDDEQKESFVSWLEDNIEDKVYAYDQEPNRYFNSVSSVEPGEWLTHFSNSAEDIAREGFAYGAEDDDIHLSRMRNGGAEEKGPWVFAYFSQSRDAEYQARKETYGEEAVMFQSSAAFQAYHTGDEENQIIIDRSELKPRNLVYLWRTESNDWAVGPKDHPYKVGDYSDVAKWVVDNYRQFSRKLTN